MSRFIHGVAVNLAFMVSHTRQSKKLYTDFKTEKQWTKGRKLGRGGGGGRKLVNLKQKK